MRRNSNLTEGMWAGDLKDLVLGVLSVDEYESKVDAMATVVGFYVRDRDAAEDLNRFVQKSPLTLLDTDISPAPDQRGYYMVFVELLTNERTAEIISELLAEVSPLVSIASWKMRLRGEKRLVQYDEKRIIQHLSDAENENRRNAFVDGIEALAKQIERTRSKIVRPDRVLEFFEPSALSNCIVAEDVVILEGFSNTLTFRVIGLADPEVMLPKMGLHESAFAMDFASIRECEKISAILGEQWVTMRASDTFLLSNNETDEVMIVTPHD